MDPNLPYSSSWVSPLIPSQRGYIIYLLIPYSDCSDQYKGFGGCEQDCFFMKICALNFKKKRTFGCRCNFLKFIMH